MKKLLKITLIIVSIIVFAVVCLLTYLKFALPNVGPAPDLKVELTPDRINRGKYLANNVCACMDCHSTRDWSKLAGPLVPGTLGKEVKNLTNLLDFRVYFIPKILHHFH